MRKGIKQWSAVSVDGRARRDFINPVYKISFPMLIIKRLDC